MSNRVNYPDSAFAYVNQSTKLLLHHFPDKVKDGLEHDTVDNLMLDFCIANIDLIPADKETKNNITKHLKSHKANALLCAVAEDGFSYEERLKDYHTFSATLDGNQETPPITTMGCGRAKFCYNSRSKELYYILNFENLSDQETAAHFHIGMMGQPGQIIIPLELGFVKSGGVVLTAEQEDALFKGQMFVNVHSVKYPEGEIRGQIMPTSTAENAPRLRSLSEGVEEKAEASTWTTKFINDLPDSSFAVVEKGGKKDDGGKTVPRNYRHLPYKDGSGKIDLPHLRNALARMNQVEAVSPDDSTDRIREVATRVLTEAAKKALPDSKFAKGEMFGAQAKLKKVKKHGHKSYMSLTIGDNPDNGYNDCMVDMEVEHDANGTPMGIRIYDNIIPASAISGLTEFLSMLSKDYENRPLPENKPEEVKVA